jgi:membrane-bound lytic murein transglycosylase D
MGSVRHRRALLGILGVVVIACLIPRGACGEATADSSRFEPEKFASHPRVAHFLRFFQGAGRERMTRWLQRGERYMPMIRDRLSALKLPDDLRFLPLIESGFANLAVSRAGAVGMWQLMPETARRYGLRVDGTVDERRDPSLATGAATRHLRDLFDRFGSPFLAAAAYNAGAGSVERGLDRLAETNPSDSTFFRLTQASALASETADYVPQLLAAVIIARNPEQYGFKSPSEGSALPACDSVVVTKPIRLSTAARLAGIPEGLVRDLNPKYVRGITPSQGISTILMPAGLLSADFARALAALPPESPAPAASVTASASDRADGRPPRAARNPHVIVRRGDTPCGIANRYGVSEIELRRLNLITRKMQLRAGQILRLP